MLLLEVLPQNQLYHLELYHHQNQAHQLVQIHQLVQFLHLIQTHQQVHLLLLPASNHFLQLSSTLMEMIQIHPRQV